MITLCKAYDYFPILIMIRLYGYYIRICISMLRETVVPPLMSYNG